MCRVKGRCRNVIDNVFHLYLGGERGFGLLGGERGLSPTVVMERLAYCASMVSVGEKRDGLLRCDGTAREMRMMEC